MFQAMRAYQFWRQAELKAEAEHYLQMKKGDAAAATRAAKIWVYAEKRVRGILFQEVRPFVSFN